MSPSKSQNENNVHKQIYNCVPSPLKINKISHTIKKSPPSSSSNVSPPLQTQTQPQRHPVIIYTQSPKVIHTQPKDFMALVQKLTGKSARKLEDATEDQKPKTSVTDLGSDSKNKTLKAVRVDSEALSSEEDDKRVIWSSNNNQRCYYGPQKQILGSRSGDLFCPNQPFYGYSDSFLFGGPSSITNHVPSSHPTVLLEGLNHFWEY